MHSSNESNPGVTEAGTLGACVMVTTKVSASREQTVLSVVLVENAFRLVVGIVRGGTGQVASTSRVEEANDRGVIDVI